jgi:hypothetical protein
VLKIPKVFSIDNFHAIFHGHQSSDPVQFEERSDALLHGAYVQHFVTIGEE